MVVLAQAWAKCQACMYVHVCNFVYMYVSIHQPYVSSYYHSIYLSIHPSIHPSIHLSTYLSIYLFIYLSIYLSIHPSIYLSIYLSLVVSFRGYNKTTRSLEQTLPESHLDSIRRNYRV